MTDDQKARVVAMALRGVERFIYDNPRTGLREVYKDSSLYQTYDPRDYVGDVSTFGKYAEPTELKSPR